jgi:hypothetical protein
VATDNPMAGSIAGDAVDKVQAQQAINDGLRKQLEDSWNIEDTQKKRDDKAKRMCTWPAAVLLCVAAELPPVRADACHLVAHVDTISRT